MERKSPQASIALISILFLTNCGDARINEATLEQAKRNAESAVRDKLSKNVPFYSESCSLFFSAGTAQSVDQTVNGNSGSLTVQVPVTIIENFNSDDLVTRNCLGMPLTGLQAGQTIRLEFHMNAEKWESGWRLGQMRLARTLL